MKLLSTKIVIVLVIFGWLLTSLSFGYYVYVATSERQEFVRFQVQSTMSGMGGALNLLRAAKQTQWTDPKLLRAVPFHLENARQAAQSMQAVTAFPQSRTTQQLRACRLNELSPTVTDIEIFVFQQVENLETGQPVDVQALDKLFFALERAQFPPQLAEVEQWSVIGQSVHVLNQSWK